MSEPSSKPNGGLDVNLYPAAFVTQSSMTIIGYTLTTFKNMDKIAFRTGVAAELGVSLAAVEIDGVFNGKVPTDEDNAPMKLRRRLLAAATTHGCICVGELCRFEIKKKPPRAPPRAFL